LPNLTIYVREADSELWETARRLAGDSLSGLVAEAVRQYVATHKEKGEDEMANRKTRIVRAYLPDGIEALVVKDKTGDTLILPNNRPSPRIRNNAPSERNAARKAKGGDSHSEETR